jgi:hypothetical protein
MPVEMDTRNWDKYRDISSEAGGNIRDASPARHVEPLRVEFRLQLWLSLRNLPQRLGGLRKSCKLLHCRQENNKNPRQMPYFLLTYFLVRIGFGSAGCMLSSHVKV